MDQVVREWSRNSTMIFAEGEGRVGAGRIGKEEKERGHKVEEEQEEK